MGAALKIVEDQEWTTLTLDGMVRKSILPEMTEALKKVDSAKKCKAVLVDFATVSTIDEGTLHALAAEATKFKLSKIKFYVVRANSIIQSRITQDGLDMALLMKNTAEEALTEMGIKPKPKFKIDVELINPFIEGTIRTLQVQANIKATPGVPFLRKDAAMATVDIVAILGLMSKHFNGSIALCFNKGIFLTIVNSMLGEEATEITEDNADAAGELLNIIFGAAKETLNKKDYGIQQAIPSVIRGHEIQLKNVMSDPTIVLPISTDKGNFEIQIGVLTGI